MTAPSTPTSSDVEAWSTSRRIGPELVKFRAGRHLVAAAPTVALAIFLVFAVRAGLDPGHAVAGVLAVVLTQVVPGMLIWRLLRPQDGFWTEDVVMGFAIGVVLAVASQTVAGLLAAPWLAMMVGPLVAIGLAGLPRTRSRLRRGRTSILPTMWGPAVAGVALLLLEQAQAFYRTVPYQWEGFRETHLDMPFHLALVGQIAQRGPTAMPHVSGEPLQYHWFSHAWVAQIVNASGVPIDGVLYRLVPPLISVAVVCAIAVVAVRVSGRAWVGPLAALLAVAAGDLDVANGVSAGFLVNHQSPSHGVGLLVLTALVMVLILRWRGEARPGAAWLIPVLGLVAAGSKGSTLPVVVAGACLAWAGALVFARHRLRAVGHDVVLLGAALGLGFTIVFGGAASGVAFDPGQALASAAPTRAIIDGRAPGEVPLIVAAAAILLVAVIARGVGMGGLLLDPEARRDPVTLLLLGTGLAGALAMLLLAHPGRSQVYFLRSAAPFLAIGSAWGLSVAASKIRHPGAVVAAGLGAGLLSSWLVGIWDVLMVAPPLLVAVSGMLAVGLVGAVAAALVRGVGGAGRHHLLVVLSVCVLSTAVIPILWSRVTPSLPDHAPAVAPGSSVSFSDDQVAAARWLRDHSAAHDLVMTNRHCQLTNADRCGPRRFHVAAYTERTILVEGWGYTPTWWASDRPRAERPFWNQDLLNLNDRFLRTPSHQDAGRLMELGVDWVYVDKTVPYSRDLTQFATPRHETQWSWVLELTDGS